MMLSRLALTELSAMKMMLQIMMNKLLKFDKTARPNGFTLVELMIVLMIMATMVAIIAPYATRSNESLNIKQETLSLELAVKYITDLAMDTRRSTRIILNQKTNSFALEIAADTSNQNFLPIEKIGNIGNHFFNQNIRISDIEGFEMQGDNYYLLFDPSKPWPSGSVSLSITDLISTIDIEGKRIEIKYTEI